MTSQTSEYQLLIADADPHDVSTFDAKTLTKEARRLARGKGRYLGWRIRVTNNAATLVAIVMTPETEIHAETMRL